MEKVLKVGLTKQELIGQVLNERYIITKHIGGGSFGDVFEAEDSVSESIVALKFETGAAKNPQLQNEYLCYRILSKGTNIPRVYNIFDFKNSRVLAMEKMGPCLETLFRKANKKFTLKTVCMIADQMIRTIEYVHNCGLVHRDIKPQNFLIGRGPLKSRIYLIDFGVSAHFIDVRTGEHIGHSSHNGLIGTAFYVSINTHLGDQQSRRDDLESILYVLIRFMKGSLPWQVYKHKKADRNEKITQSKLTTQLGDLCGGLPNEFRLVLDYIRHLRYDETPKYTWIRQQFKNVLAKNGFVYDGVFDWDEAAAIHPPLPSYYLIYSSIAFVRKNERLIKGKKKPKVHLPEQRNIFLCALRNNY